MPAHVWLVHLPIGLSVSMPFVLFSCAWMARQRPAAWWLAVVAVAALATSAVIASSAGEDEARRLGGAPRGPGAEAVAADRFARAVRAHEDAADRFTWSACALVGLVLAAASLKPGGARTAVQLACAVLSLGLVVLAWDAGHAGGALIWWWDIPSWRPKD